MRVLYILLLVFMGCNKNNFRDLTFKQKERIINLLAYNIQSEEEIDNFVSELKIEDYKVKIENMLKLNKNNSIKGKELLLEAIKEDEIKVLEAYYNYEAAIFNSSIKRNQILIKTLLEIVCNNRASKCLVYLVNILTEQEDYREVIDTSKLIDIILKNQNENIIQYKELRETYFSVSEDKKNILNTFTAPKPAIDVKDVTSIGIGLGSIGIGALKLSEDKPLKSALIVGGALLIAVPAYLYYKNYSKYSIEASLKEEKLKDIDKKINVTQSNIEEIKEEIEQRELSIIKCLIEKFSFFVREDLIEKFEKAEKQKIAAYIKEKTKTNSKNKGIK